MVLVAGSGCLLDFDEFDVANDAGTEVDAGDDAEMPGEDMAMIPDPLRLGIACAEDAECGDGGRCVDAMCTAACSADADCPEGARCGAFSGATYCLLVCESDCSFVDNDGLSCAPTADTVGETLAACLPDSDGDGVADQSDNCAEDANPRQEDADGDGVGDVCDDDPVCPDGHVDGLVEYGSIGAELSGFGMPTAIEGPILPLVGGFDGDQSPVDLVHVVDRSAGAIEEVPVTLPYAAGEHAVAQTPGGAYLISPGAFTLQGQQFGDWYNLLMGGVAAAFDPSQAFVRPISVVGLDGTIWMVGYDLIDAMTARWRLYRMQPGQTSFTTVRIGNDAALRRWNVTHDPQGRIHFYSSAPNGNGYLITVSPGSAGHTFRGIDYADQTPFEPLLVPGVGEVFWAFDRLTGLGYQVHLPTNAVVAVPEIDTTFDFDEVRFATQGTGTAYVAVGKPAGGAGLTAYGKFLACDPATEAIDLDMDTVSDIVDNCPLDANTDQVDTDADSIGDVCDNDDDNDGVGDAADFTGPSDMQVDLSLDTDNDGTPNSMDDDDDADGIADVDDVYPFDTDNDGLHNGFDTDDDGDGYLDIDESDGGDPLNPAVFPGIGQIVVAKNDGGRTVEIHELETGTVTPVAFQTATPHNPRFGPNRQGVMVLGDAPETTSEVEWFDGNGNFYTYDVALPIRAADAISINGNTDELANIVVNVLVDEVSGQWAIGTYGIGTMLFEPRVNVFPNLSGADFESGSVVFTGGPPGCSDCTKAYRSSISGGTPLGFAPDAKKPVLTRWNGQRYFAVADATEGDGQSVFVSTGIDVTEVPVPDGAEIRDVVGPLGTGDSTFFATLKFEDTTYDVWLYNDRVDAWLPVIAGDAGFVEIDWRN